MAHSVNDPLAVQLGIVESLQRRGWAVFPVLHGDKLPAGKWTVMSESVPTPDMLQTSEWFGVLRNIGIATGPSNLVVIDEDRYNAFTELAARLHQELPTTYTVETGKGRHFYFEAPDDVRITNSSGQLKQYGIDVRGAGGYVVAEGSLHPNGNVYRAMYPWEETRPLPEWVIDMILERGASTLVSDANLAPPQKSISEHTPFTRAQAEEYLKVPYQRLISSQQGEQNAVLNSYAFALGHFASENPERGFYSAEEAQKMCLEAARLCGYYFRDAFGADKTIRSGLVAGMNDPYLMAFDSPQVVELHDDPGSGDLLEGWRPVNLDDVLAGTKVRPLPTIGVKRSDGTHFLYAAREHLAMGLTEGGKSWFALANAMAEIERGNKVLYVHFEEEDEVDTVTRLMVMGARHEDIRHNFMFVGASRRIHPAVVDHFELPENRPTLVIIDGINEAMSLHGLAVREEDGAATVRRLLVKPFTHMGAAVLSLDHVVKDREARGEGYALGSIHKVNGLTGASFLLENVEPFGVGRTGKTRVFVTKDRPGALRKGGLPDAKHPNKFLVAEMTIDSRVEDTVALILWKPSDDRPSAEDITASKHRKVVKAVRALEARGAETNIDAVRAEAEMNATAVRESLAWCVSHGELSESRGDRNARIFATVAVLHIVTDE